MPNLHFINQKFYKIGKLFIFYDDYKSLPNTRKVKWTCFAISEEERNVDVIVRNLLVYLQSPEIERYFESFGKLCLGMNEKIRASPEWWENYVKANDNKGFLERELILCSKLGFTRERLEILNTKVAMFLMPIEVMNIHEEEINRAYAQAK